MLHAQHPAVDGHDDVPGVVRMLFQKGQGVLLGGGEECGDETGSEVAGEQICLEREGSKEDGHGVIVMEELLLEVARWGRQALQLEPGRRVGVHADGPPDAGSVHGGEKFGQWGRSGRLLQPRVQLSEKVLSRHNLSFSVGYDEGSLPGDFVNL